MLDSSSSGPGSSLARVIGDYMPNKKIKTLLRVFLKLFLLWMIFLIGLLLQHLYM